MSTNTITRIGLVVGVFFLVAMPAQAGEYFRYQRGDTASFEADRFDRPIQMAVDKAIGLWRHLRSVPGLGDLWMWSHPNREQTYVWSPVLRSPQLLADFSAPVATTTRIDLDPCNRGEVTIGARGLEVTTPAGTFKDVVRLDLVPSCNDGGVVNLSNVRLS